MAPLYLQYFTQARHTSAIHRNEFFKRASCMPSRDLDQQRVALHNLDTAQQAYTAGAKVCRKCFPDGLPMHSPALSLTDAVKNLPPLRKGELLVVACNPNGGRATVRQTTTAVEPDRCGPTMARWIGDEARQGRFYASYGDAARAFYGGRS